MAENERKIVVRYGEELHRHLETLRTWREIEQTYLTPNARVRLTTFSCGIKMHEFTFKLPMINGENFEINQEISEEDHRQAATMTKVGVQKPVRKHRATIHHERIQWDIDLYSWSRPYFILAEAEMPSGMDMPPHILPLIEPHVVSIVPRRDAERFTARRLADESHAASLAQELGLL